MYGHISLTMKDEGVGRFGLSKGYEEESVECLFPPV